MKNIHAKPLKDQYLLLNEFAIKFNLSFSSYFKSGSKLIALDGIKKCLVVLEAGGELSQVCIIELVHVNSISVKKTYGSIGPGELEDKKFEEFLNRIDLQFEYTGENDTIALSFYNSETDQLSELPRLERNAKNWQMILSKMVGLQHDRKVREKNRLSAA